MTDETTTAAAGTAFDTSVSGTKPDTVPAASPTPAEIAAPGIGTTGATGAPGSTLSPPGQTGATGPTGAAPPVLVETPIDDLQDILKRAVKMPISGLSIAMTVAMPDGGASYLSVALSKNATASSKSGSVEDMMATLERAVDDNAFQLSESMVVEGGFICQVALARC